MRERLLVAIFAGGACGGLARTALEREWPANGHGWPWVTFAVNLAGTAILAYVVLAMSDRRYARPLLGVGFCGALTTFSTLQLEALELAHGHHVWLALAYAAGTVAGGLLVASGMRALAHPGTAS